MLFCNAVLHAPIALGFGLRHCPVWAASKARVSDYPGLSRVLVCHLREQDGNDFQKHVRDMMKIMKEYEGMIYVKVWSCLGSWCKR